MFPGAWNTVVSIDFFEVHKNYTDQSVQNVHVIYYFKKSRTQIKACTFYSNILMFYLIFRGLFKVCLGFQPLAHHRTTAVVLHSLRLGSQYVHLHPAMEERNVKHILDISLR